MGQRLSKTNPRGAHLPPLAASKPTSDAAQRLRNASTARGELQAFTDMVLESRDETPPLRLVVRIDRAGTAFGHRALDGEEAAFRTRRPEWAYPLRAALGEREGLPLFELSIPAQMIVAYSDRELIDAVNEALDAIAPRSRAQTQLPPARLSDLTRERCGPLREHTGAVELAALFAADPNDYMRCHFVLVDPQMDRRAQAEALVEAVEALDRAAVSGQDKVDAFLRTAIELEERGSHPWAELDAVERARIVTFLEKNATGRGGWRADVFHARIERLPMPYDLKERLQKDPVLKHLLGELSRMGSEQFGALIGAPARAKPASGAKVEVHELERSAQIEMLTQQLDLAQRDDAVGGQEAFNNVLELYHPRSGLELKDAERQALRSKLLGAIRADVERRAAIKRDTFTPRSGRLLREAALLLDMPDLDSGAKRDILEFASRTLVELDIGKREDNAEKEEAMNILSRAVESMSAGELVEFHEGDLTYRDGTASGIVRRFGIFDFVGRNRAFTERMSREMSVEQLASIVLHRQAGDYLRADARTFFAEVLAAQQEHAHDAGGWYALLERVFRGHPEALDARPDLKAMFAQKAEAFLSRMSFAEADELRAQGVIRALLPEAAPPAREPDAERAAEEPEGTHEPEPAQAPDPELEQDETSNDRPEVTEPVASEAAIAPASRAPLGISEAKRAIYDLRSVDKKTILGGRVGVAPDPQATLFRYYPALAVAALLARSGEDFADALEAFLAKVSIPEDLRPQLLAAAGVRPDPHRVPKHGPLGDVSYPSLRAFKEAREALDPNAVRVSDEFLISAYGLGCDPIQMEYFFTRSENADPDLRRREIHLAAHMAELGIAFKLDERDPERITDGLTASSANAESLRRLARALRVTEALFELEGKQLDAWAPSPGLAAAHTEPPRFGRKSYTKEEIEKAIKDKDASIFDMDRESYERLKSAYGSDGSWAREVLSNQRSPSWRVPCLRFWETCISHDRSALGRRHNEDPTDLIARCYHWDMSFPEDEEVDAYLSLVLRVGLPLDRFRWHEDGRSGGWKDLERDYKIRAAIERRKWVESGGLPPAVERRTRFPKPALVSSLGDGTCGRQRNAPPLATPNAELLTLDDQYLEDLHFNEDGFDMLTWLDTLEDERVFDFVIRMGNNSRLKTWGTGERAARNFLAAPIPERHVNERTLPKIVALANIAHLPLDGVRIETKDGSIPLAEHPLLPDGAPSERKARAKSLAQAMKALSSDSSSTPEQRVASVESLIAVDPPERALELREIAEAIIEAKRGGRFGGVALTPSLLARMSQSIAQAFGYSFQAPLLVGLLADGRSKKDVEQAVAESLKTELVTDATRERWGRIAASITKLSPDALAFVLHGALGPGVDVVSLEDRLRLCGTVDRARIDAYFEERGHSHKGLAPLLHRAFASGLAKQAQRDLIIGVIDRAVDRDPAIRSEVFAAVQACPPSVRAEIAELAMARVDEALRDLAESDDEHAEGARAALVETIIASAGYVPAARLAEHALDQLYAADVRTAIPLGKADQEEGSDAFRLTFDSVNELADRAQSGNAPALDKKDWQWMEADVLRAIREGRALPDETLLGLSEAFQLNLVSGEVVRMARDAASPEQVMRVADRTPSRVARALWMDRPLGTSPQSRRAFEMSQVDVVPPQVTRGSHAPTRSDADAALERTLLIPPSGRH
jgi:hypothetical protein